MNIITKWDYLKKRHSPQRKNIKYLKKLYNKNSKSDEFIINLVLYKYEDIFNIYDNRPYHNKKLNNEVKDFLQQSFRDIPNLFDIKLRITILDENKSETMEKNIIRAIKNTYNFDSKYLLRNFNRMRIKVMIYILIAIALLGAGYIFEETSLKRVLVESVSIGGWVFLWEAIHIVFMDRYDLLYELNNTMRSADSNIIFNYSNKN